MIFPWSAVPPGYVSLKTQHGTYLVTTPPGRLASWHRGRRFADDFEKFKFIYNKDESSKVCRSLHLGVFFFLNPKKQNHTVVWKHGKEDGNEEDGYES